MVVMLTLKSTFGIGPFNQAGSHVGDGIPTLVV